MFKMVFSFATGREGELEEAEVCMFLAMFIIMAVFIADV